MTEKKSIKGFLHYRTDIGDGVRTGVVFENCTESCSAICDSYRFIPEHEFSEDSLEMAEYTAEELISYLKEERTMYYARKLGITFLGNEPLRDPFFCVEVAQGLQEAGISLQIYTCGMCSMTAFELLDGYVDLYILRVFPPFVANSEKALFDRFLQCKKVIEFFEHHGTHYRLFLPIFENVTLNELENFAELLLDLKFMKSVMLDFSISNFTESEKTSFKAPFLKRKIPLY